YAVRRRVSTNPAADFSTKGCIMPRRYNSWALATVALAGFALGSTARFPVNHAAAADQNELKKSDATFEVYKDKAGEFRWRLKTTNQQVIASSGEGYKEKRS